MFINTESDDFEADAFSIVNFYGKETCFAWKNDALVCFTYNSQFESTDNLKIFKAPAAIKSIRCFDQRVFLLLKPYGIYKVTEKLQFVLLSQSAIELGSGYAEVISPVDGILYLKNKKREQKIAKELFHITSPISELSVLSLNYDTTDKSFFNALKCQTLENNSDLCLITYGKKVFSRQNESVQLIYSCHECIKNVKPIKILELTIGALLQTDTTIILLHIAENQIKFDKINFNTKINHVCTYINKDVKNILLLIHSDHTKIYYHKKIFNQESTHLIKTDKKICKSLQIYKSHYLVYLNDNNELIQTSLSEFQFSHNEIENNFIKLENNMLNGLERIIGVISEKARELETLSTNLLEYEDALKRINLYAHQKHIYYYPEFNVQRILDQMFLSSNFHMVLPVNSIVIRMLKCDGKIVFSMKKVTDKNTIVDMQITSIPLTPSLYVTTDLISYKNEGGPWCLIRNYVRDPPDTKTKEVHLTMDKLKFIELKLQILKSLGNDIDMETLSNIKSSIRQEIGNFQ